ncbi:MAG: hypothetical protein HRU09_07435 [Oligoflexales bacterium]|nr:hypothetical protein [Oligoflexales bacterium]
MHQRRTPLACLTKLVLAAILFSSSFSARVFAQALDHAATSADVGEGEIGLSFRHIVILQADLTNIWGTYFFAVTNKTSGNKNFKTSIMLPRESVDFKAQDGLEDQDLRLDENGQLYLDKEFPPGVSLLGVSFQVKADKVGNDSISFSPPFDLQEFSVAVPSRSGIQVQGEQFKEGVPPMLADGRYKGMQVSDVKKDQILQIHISGIPKDRMLLWVVGVIFTVIMALVSIGLTMKTRVTGGSEAEDQII